MNRGSGLVRVGCPESRLPVEIPAGLRRAGPILVCRGFACGRFRGFDGGDIRLGGLLGPVPHLPIILMTLQGSSLGASLESTCSGGVWATCLAVWRHEIAHSRTHHWC